LHHAASIAAYVWAFNGKRINAMDAGALKKRNPITVRYAASRIAMSWH